jgi:serine/threonine-protein kinase greatwall
MATTPFRTPKSVRGKRNIPENNNADRILGTPDYLAPELLLRLPHSYGVDWWGLGVCLYEFMTGIPPFTDETPERVFDNILNMRMEWPEEQGEVLSDSAVAAIKAMLTFDQRNRADFEQMQTLDLFKNLDWTNLTEIEAPFIPQPDDETDTGYFEARNTAQQWKVSQIKE